tara:strand:- start:952 stop:1653 length:702 start_codon:yes stop_codon:yes gene_type:complete
MIGLAKVAKSLMSAAMAASKWSKARNLTRQIPFKSVAPIVTNPQMTRKQFLRRSGKILSEARMQTGMANATSAMKRDQIAANYFLTSPSTVKKLKLLKPSDIAKIDSETGPMGSVNPFKKGTFKHQLVSNLRKSKRGYDDNGVDIILKAKKMLEGKVKPRTPLEKWWYYRDLMSKHYGHRQGTGSYANKAFEIPKTDVWHGHGVLPYVKELSKKMNQGANPLLQAFREGLYGK